MRLQSFHEVTTNHQHVYLSPHFDDVVYSCGATLARQANAGERPLVVTIFGGVPSPELKLSSFALRIHQAMGGGPNAEAMFVSRRQEDAQALTYLGADYLWLDYFDAIYRGSPVYYADNGSLFGKIHPGDLWIEKQLAQELLTLYECQPGATWYVPLGIGLHVDHQIVFSAVSRLVELEANVKFYEDFPYARQESRLRKRLNELRLRLEPVDLEVSKTIHARQAAAEMYTSQVKLNFGNKDAMYKAIQDYTKSIHPQKDGHVERYWVPGGFVEELEDRS